MAASKTGAFPGCTFSSSLNKHLTSTKIPDLDVILNGGIYLGNLLLIEEQPCDTSFSLDFLLALVLGGCELDQSCCWINPINLDRADVDKKLERMRKKRNGKAEKQAAAALPAQMMNAWRYNSNPMVDTSLSGEGTSVSAFKTIEKISLLEFPAPVEDIETWMAEFEAFLNVNPAPSRVFLPSIDLLFIEDSTEARSIKLNRFLFRLSHLLKRSNSIGFVSISASIDEAHYRRRLYRHADIVLRFKTVLSEKEKTAQLLEFDSILEVVKLPVVNSFKTRLPVAHGDMDYGVKYTRDSRLLLFERLHIPPELPDSAQREQDEGVKRRVVCAGGDAKNLEF